MDDDGAIQVVEALLAGTIILTAVLFLTSASSPSPSAAQSGIDLAELAQDTLTVMESEPADDNVVGDGSGNAPLYAHRLEEIVSLALGKNQADLAEYQATNAVTKAYLDEIIPLGNRYQLRIDNGVQPLTLVPDDSSFRSQPRAAKAAETFIAPPWQDNVAFCTGGATDLGTFYPGGAGPTILATDVLKAPNGATIGPAGDTWAVWWTDNDEDANANTITPASALYGWWAIEADNECFRVDLNANVSTDQPLYGVQLVVWPIAG